MEVVKIVVTNEDFDEFSLDLGRAWVKTHIVGNDGPQYSGKIENTMKVSQVGGKVLVKFLKTEPKREGVTRGYLLLSKKDVDSPQKTIEKTVILKVELTKKDFFVPKGSKGKKVIAKLNNKSVYDIFNNSEEIVEQLK